jgi:hypothetical protein
MHILLFLLPITVDRDYTLQTVQALDYEAAALEQQTSGTLRSQLAIMRQQLAGLKQHFEMAAGMQQQQQQPPQPIVRAPQKREPMSKSQADIITRLRAPDSSKPRLPPRPAKRVLLDNNTFFAIVKVMRAEEYNEEKLAILEEVADGWWFQVGQLAQLCAMLNVGEDKLQAITITARSLVDKQNAEALYALFDSDGDKRRVQQILTGK